MKFFTFCNRKVLIVLYFLGFYFYSIGQKTWVGAGAGGSGTDFNTGSNWSPAGVPTASDNVIIALTGNATINLSANASINNLTYTIGGNNNVGGLYVGANQLTVNGTTSISIVSGNNNTSHEIGVNGGTSAGTIIFIGNVTLSTGTTGSGSGFAGNTNSKFIFRGNLTLGIEAYVNITNRPGTWEFDGTGTQTITWDNSTYYCEPNNVIIGNTNNPTVNHAGSVVSDNILGNLTVNGFSTLNLGTRYWNGGTASGGTGNAGTLSLNNAARLQLGAATGGQTGSNFPIRFSALNIGSGSTVEYTGSVAQTIYAVPSPGYGNLTLTNNSTKSPTAALTIRGNLLNNSTSTFSAGTALTHTVGGNWTNNNVFTAGTSTISFNGSALQSISGTSSTTFYNLTANNTAGNTTTGISLQSPVIVTNFLSLTSGHITTTSTNILTMNAGSSVSGSGYAPPVRASGGSDNSFVNGPMRKIGNTNFLFPIGKINAGHHYCGISASAATQTFTAEYMRASAKLLGTVTAPGLDHVSNCEYWDISRTSGSTAVDVVLSWNGNSNCNAAVYVDDLATLIGAHYSGGSWSSAGGAYDFLGSTVSAGSLTWSGVNSFSPFSLGSTSAATNPLPVKLVNVKAYKTGDRNKIEWTNLTEADVINYELEKSIDGTRFETMSSLAPKTNANNREDYIEYDLQPSPVTYYRIKVISLGSRNVYSPVVKVAAIGTLQQDIVLYPNPVTGKQFTLQMNSAAGNYLVRVYGANGQVIKTETLKHPGGSFSKTIELPGQLQSGQYYLQVTGGEQILTSKFIIQ